MDQKSEGVDLKDYVETRFNLLIESMKDKMEAQDDAVSAGADAAKAAGIALRASMDAATTATDLRYQQRFEAQSDALAAAFLSQKTAMQTAFIVAEKAVQAALAAADRAVSKAELASDKRFEALNELRQMLNDMVGNLMPRPESTQRFDTVMNSVHANASRITALEERVNTSTGADVGVHDKSIAMRSQLAIAAAVVSMLLSLALFMWERLAR